MADILSGLVLVNGTDIWTEYGVFLVEDRRGGMENLTAILTPSRAKKDTAVDIREEHGEKYSAVLTPGAGRDTALCPIQQDPDRLDEAVLCICEFSETGKGRLAGDPFPPAGPAAEGEVCRLHEVYPADLSVDGRRACGKVPGEVQGTETYYITIKTLLEYAYNDI